MQDLIETLRTLRNGAANDGDMETACKHERRLQILLGVPESFTAKHPTGRGYESVEAMEEIEDYGGERTAPCVGCGGPHPYQFCGTDVDEVNRE